jgi:hypothetical protein
VRVVEHSVLWKEKEASKVFIYQGLTTCTEVDKSWTIMSSAYNLVRSKRGDDERSMAMFIREEVEHQERLEAAGYRSPTWRVLRALQSLLSATQLQGESAVAAPAVFPNAGRGTVRFWGNEQGPTSSCGMAWMKRGGRNANVQSRHEKIGLCGAERDQ